MCYCRPSPAPANAAQEWRPAVEGRSVLNLFFQRESCAKWIKMLHNIVACISSCSLPVTLKVRRKLFTRSAGRPAASPSLGVDSALTFKKLCTEPSSVFSFVSELDRTTSCRDVYQLTKQENPLMLKYCGEPQWFTKCGSVVVLNSREQSGDPHRAPESNTLKIC